MGRFAISQRLAIFFGIVCLLVVGGEFFPTVMPISPTAPATAVAQEDKKADDGEPAPKPQQSFLAFFFEALGIRYIIAFGFLSFTFVAVLVMNMLSVRRDSICPLPLADAFEANLNEKKFQEAFDLAKSDESFLGKMLAAGMQNLQGGYDKSMAAMGQVGEEEQLKLDQRLSFIGLIGTVAPMVGLLGTVDGMVASFIVIAQSSTQPKPSELAKGISMALITTLVGLVLAIPAIVAFNLIKNRITKLVMESGQQVDRLMSRFEKK